MVVSRYTDNNRKDGDQIDDDNDDGDSRGENEDGYGGGG